jgi:hypothetical protein
VVSPGFTDEVGRLVGDEREDALVLDCFVYQMSKSLFDMLRQNPAGADLPIVILRHVPERADCSLRRRPADRAEFIPQRYTGAQVARALDQRLAVASG